MEYDNFGTLISGKRTPSFIPNRINAISGKQLMSGTGISSDLEMEGNALFAFRNTFTETENVEGFRLGIDQFDNQGKFFIGDSNHFFKWDGNNATINGILFSTEGNIAGWTITNTALTGNKVRLSSGGVITSGDFTGRRTEIDGINENIIFYNDSGVKAAVIDVDTSDPAFPNIRIDVTANSSAGGSASFGVDGAANIQVNQAPTSGLITVDIAGGIVNVTGRDVTVIATDGVNSSQIVMRPDSIMMTSADGSDGSLIQMEPTSITMSCSVAGSITANGNILG